MSAVDRVLADCGLAPADLDGLAVSVGPGSFTGLRVGLATVKALAMALDLPVAAVPTLDALASRLPFADAPVCPILDARKAEVYLSLYRWSGDGMTRVWDYMGLPPEAAAARLEAPVILSRDGIEACRPWLDRLGDGIRIAPAAQRLPSAAAVATLGRAVLASGAGVDAETLAPLYSVRRRPSSKRGERDGRGARAQRRADGRERSRPGARDRARVLPDSMDPRAFCYEIEQNKVARCTAMRARRGIVGYLCFWEIGHEIHIPTWRCTPSGGAAAWRGTAGRGAYRGCLARRHPRLPRGEAEQHARAGALRKPGLPGDRPAQRLLLRHGRGRSRHGGSARRRRRHAVAGNQSAGS